MNKTFFAYPNKPPDLGITIENAIKEINSVGEKVLSWKALDIIGNFINKEIVDGINGRVFVADITVLNCNVIYELGYANMAATKKKNFNNKEFFISRVIPVNS